MDKVAERTIESVSNVLGAPSTMTNPLAIAQRPYAFDQISAEHIEPAILGLVTDAKKALDDIANASRPLTYDNTFGALDQATEPLGVSMGIV